MNQSITITRTGVTEIKSWADTQIKVNSEDVVYLLEKEIEKAAPKRDYNEAFAARVTITVELLGDLEEK